MAKIEMGRKYRSVAGKNFKILTVDRPNMLPVVGMDDDGNIYCFTDTGHSFASDDLNLVEVSPYEDFKVDDVVMCRLDDACDWHVRHFACVREGVPYAWSNGKTSNGEACNWKECRKPTQEELTNLRTTF